MSYRGIGGGGYPYKSSSRGVAMNAVPPPPSTSAPIGRRGVGIGSDRKPGASSGLSKHGYTTMDSISQFASTQQSLGKRKAHTEDEYFDDDEDQTPELAYIPAPGSPGAVSKQAAASESEEEDDPLDQFMAGIEQQVQKEKVRAQKAEIAVASSMEAKGIRTDIDDEDDEESYYRYMEENPMAGVRDDTSDVEIDYDEDGNPIAPPKNRNIDPLPQIYHSEIEYEKFEKNFYAPHEDIAALSDSQVADLRRTLGVKVTGPEPPKPVTSFGHFGFDEPLIKAIRKAEYTQPTPIQAQAIPAALGGRDIIGIAKTGSGKTAAFVWPMLVHIMDQRELREGDGPIGLILAPTRELSLQIYNEAKKFGKVYNINVVCCYGGGSKWEQSKALEQGAEVVVATPGRMIDMVKMKATNLRRVTYLVLDEADRMFNMGFEPQVRSICNHVRPDRQTLLFSATFKKRIERLARDVLTDPVRIIQGDLGEANQDITQQVFVFNNPQQKWNWLLLRLVGFLSQGSVLVFVTKKLDAETVANNLMVKEYSCLLLHGDMDQADRNKVITAFKKKDCDILVATDVAARGLDIPHIRTVINYDIARDIDTHTHRIGRTGRAGEKGNAFTLVSDKDKEFAGHLVRNLEGADQEVPQDLMDLAMKSSWFRNSRFKNSKGKKINVGGTGLGYRERTGFGSASSGRSSDYSESKPPAGVAPSTMTTKPAGGPASDRYSAMRDAFRTQYMSQFKPSSDRTWEQTVPEAGVFAAPAPPPSFPPPSSNKTPASSTQDATSKRGKKSRWN
ncbi:ATP-dependent RNA helicase DDX42 [Eupeodes corollae]|uniref:ATP-dependent RNA helicase DDX42 n=1 Tax=Eupeodes corollae TaxID=290404 RepID=UPI00248F9F67|nr:ATP-dependent RNA helicase DDX42 [Eupeodes corollae]